MLQSLTSAKSSDVEELRSNLMADVLALAGRIFIGGVFLISAIGKISAPVATIGLPPSVYPFPS